MKTNFIRTFLSLTVFFYAYTLIAQPKPVPLIESNFTVRNSNSEDYYFGLAEGDQITFSIDVTDNTIKNVEFNEYPNTTMFSQGNVGTIENKTLNITHKGIYYFHFHQSGFLAGRRNCTLKATRLPASEKTVNFNTTVYWKEIIDTVWYNEEEKYLISVDTLVTPIANQSIKLKRRGKTDRSMIMFTLPEKLDYWSVWIGTGKDAQTNFNNTETQMAANFPYIKKYGLMTALALNGSASFVTPQGCLPVSYWLLSTPKEQQKFNSDSIRFIADKKMACLDYSRRSDTLKGINYLGIYNENRKKMDVFVKIASVRIVENWGARNIRKFKLETKQVPYLKD